MLEGPASPFELNSGGDAALPRGATAEPLKGRGEGWNENTVEVRILGGSMEDPIRVSGFENHGRISRFHVCAMVKLYLGWTLSRERMQTSSN